MPWSAASSSSSSRRRRRPVALVGEERPGRRLRIGILLELSSELGDLGLELVEAFVSVLEAFFGELPSAGLDVISCSKLLRLLAASSLVLGERPQFIDPFLLAFCLLLELSQLALQLAPFFETNGHFLHVILRDSWVSCPVLSRVLSRCLVVSRAPHR